jgi:hypothetical protein
VIGGGGEIIFRPLHLPLASPEVRKRHIPALIAQGTRLRETRRLKPEYEAQVGSIAHALLGL